MNNFFNQISWSHILVAIAIFTILSLCGWSLLGAVIPVAMYYGREQRDAENVTKINPKQGWKLANPFSWPIGQQADFWPVFILMALLYFYLG